MKSPFLRDLSAFPPRFLTYCVFCHKVCLLGDTVSDDSAQSSSVCWQISYCSTQWSGLQVPPRAVRPVSFISSWPLSSADMLLFLKLSTLILLPCAFYGICSSFFHPVLTRLSLFSFNRHKRVFVCTRLPAEPALREYGGELRMPETDQLPPGIPDQQWHLRRYGALYRHQSSFRPQRAWCMYKHCTLTKGGKSIV